MRIYSPFLAASVAASAVLFAACSGGAPSGMQSLPGTAQAQSHSRSSADASGVAPRFLSMLRFGHAPMSPDRKKKKLKGLAVSDFGTGAVEILTAKYAYKDSITSDLSGPDGDYYDSKGNLYVANYSGVDVTEYNKAQTETFTYSSGLSDPVGVSTDAHGNVFVADYGFGGASVVVEYPQGSNTPSYSCSTGLANEGVSVDKKGDVFVDGNNPNTGQGNIVEYKGGLSGCSGTTLAPTLLFAGGSVMDRKGDLVVCDQDSGVDIIPPPYSSVEKTITGPVDTFHDALDPKNKTLFVADPSDAVVWVFTYPGGTEKTQIGSSQDLSDPAGVAANP